MMEGALPWTKQGLMRIADFASSRDMYGFQLELDGILEPTEVEINVTPDRTSVRHHVLNIPHVFGKMRNLCTTWRGYYDHVLGEVNSSRLRATDFEKPKRLVAPGDDQHVKLTLDDEYWGTPLHVVMGAPVHFTTIDYVTKLLIYGGAATFLAVDLFGNSIFEVAMLQVYLHDLALHTVDLFQTIYGEAKQRLKSGELRCMTARVLRRAMAYNVTTEVIEFLVNTMRNELVPARISLLEAVDRGSFNLVRYLGRMGFPPILPREMPLGAGHYVAMSCSWESEDSEFNRRLSVLKVALSFQKKEVLCFLHADPAWNGTVLHFALKHYAENPEALNPRVVSVLKVLAEFDWIKARARNSADKCPFCCLSDPQRNQLEGVRKKLIARGDGAGGSGDPCPTCDAETA